MIQRTSLALGVCVALFGAASVANAHDVALEGPIEIPEDSDAYVNADGMAVRTGGGECLRLGGFSEDEQVNACEGIEEVVEAPAPEPVAIPEPEPAPVARIEMREVEERALFEFDSADLTGDGQAAVEGLFAELAEFQGVTAISVIGHTDSSGPEEYNLSLSEQRAATVAAMLEERYPDAAIEIVGRGESDPIASNDTREGRQMNRRVEIDVTASQETFE